MISLNLLFSRDSVLNNNVAFNRLDKSDQVMDRSSTLWILLRLHRCWWRMLETKCVGDNFEMLVTVLAVFVTNIFYLLTLGSGTNIQNVSSISKFHHQHQKIVTNIKSLTSTCHQHLCSQWVTARIRIIITNVQTPIT